MTDTIYCKKLNREGTRLSFPPAPGELGKRIQENFSSEAWQEWLQLQTMLINEKRLSMGNAEHRKYLAEQVERHFFGDGADVPEGYTPPTPAS